MEPISGSLPLFCTSTFAAGSNRRQLLPRASRDGSVPSERLYKPRNIPYSALPPCCFLDSWEQHRVSDTLMVTCSYLKVPGRSSWHEDTLWCHLLPQLWPHLAWTIKSLRLEKTSKIMKSNHQHNTTVPAKPCPKVPHLHIFLTPPGMGTPPLPWAACSNAWPLFQ